MTLNNGWAVIAESVQAHYFNERLCRGTGNRVSGCGSYELELDAEVKPLAETGASSCGRCSRRADNDVLNAARPNQGKPLHKKPLSP